MAKKKTPAQIAKTMDNPAPEELIRDIEKCVVSAMQTNLPQQIIVELDSGEFLVMLFTKV